MSSQLFKKGLKLENLDDPALKWFKTPQQKVHALPLVGQYAYWYLSTKLLQTRHLQKNGSDFYKLDDVAWHELILAAATGDMKNPPPRQNKNIFIYIDVIRHAEHDKARIMLGRRLNQKL